MKRYLYTLAILPFLFLNNTCCAQAADSAQVVKSLMKCWRSISKEYATIYGLEEDEIKQYYKQKVCLGRDSITIYHGTLYGPKYAIKKVNADNFSKTQFDCTRDKLGMTTDSVYQVTILSLTKPDPKGATHKMTDIIAFDGYFLYVVKDGVIFKLFDNDAKPQGRSSN